ncbi:DC1 [Dillenia turbinata]|uniref:DC1 n=1 Tax=Dillenia turbinata TaxID=194707 RepID=A0AAN8YSP9_9MAGN
MDDLAEVDGPVIIAMKGNPCTGKTTLAEALAKELKWLLYSLELSHRSLVSIPSGRPGNLQEFYDKVGYQDDDSPQLYVILGAVSSQLLSGFSVILDADFSSRQYNLMLKDLADYTKAMLVIVECKPQNESKRQTWLDQICAAGKNYLPPKKWYKEDQEENSVDESEMIPKIMVDTTSPVDIQEHISKVVKFVISCYRFRKFNIQNPERVGGTEARKEERESKGAETGFIKNVDEEFEIEGVIEAQEFGIERIGAEEFELRHYWHQHKLTLSNEVIEYESEANCSLCLQNLSSSGQGFYSCVECRYFLDKSCAEMWLPNYFELDFHDKNHRLVLQKFSENLACEVCNQFIDQSFYHCDSCCFVTHIKCAFLPSTFEPYCHEHALSLSILHNYEFQCRACGDSGKHTFYHCSGSDLCTFFFHLKCALLPLNLKHSFSKDPFTLTSCLELRRDEDEVYCDVCEVKLDRELLVYYSRENDLVSHTTCLMSSEDHWSSSTASNYAHKTLVEKSQAANVDIDCVPEEENELRHCHRHELNYSDEVINNESATRCRLCSQTIDSSSYTCVDCGFNLHKSCAEMRLPYTLMLKIPGNNHLLNLKKSTADFDCNICTNSGDGMLYCCYWCPFVAHVKCAFLPSNLLLEFHEHSLHLSLDPIPFPYNQLFRCVACGDHGHSVFYKCLESSCTITLHAKCSLLPRTLERECHMHPLIRSLSFREEYCRICNRELDHKQWVYSCKECDYYCHLTCLTRGDLLDILNWGSQLWEYSIYCKNAYRILAKENHVPELQI